MLIPYSPGGTWLDVSPGCGSSSEWWTVTFPSVTTTSAGISCCLPSQPTKNAFDIAWLGQSYGGMIEC